MMNGRRKSDRPVVATKPANKVDVPANKAEALAANNARSIEKDSFVDWLWEKLETDFGFHPPW